MELSSHRRDQKVKPRIGGIRIVELRNNKAWLIDGSYEGQGNIIIQII